MAMAGDSTDAGATQERELQFGSETLAFGDDLIAFGADITQINRSISRLTPEQVVVAACRSVSVPARPLYEAGKPTLPSVIFQSVAATALDGFERSITTQALLVTVRAAEYGNLIRQTERVYGALRKFPEERVRSISGFSDGFADDFSFYYRTLTVEIQR